MCPSITICYMSLSAMLPTVSVYWSGSQITSFLLTRATVGSVIPLFCADRKWQHFLHVLYFKTQYLNSETYSFVPSLILRSYSPSRFYRRFIAEWWVYALILVWRPPKFLISAWLHVYFYWCFLPLRSFLGAFNSPWGQQFFKTYHLSGQLVLYY